MNEMADAAELTREGLRLRPGSALVPRLRRLRDPQGGAAHAAGARHPTARRPCSSPASAARRAFPITWTTYGFHTIHGRAPAIATGVKLANPELDVWVITGDGDGLSIGGNHLLHVLRRNVDIKILLFNNEIYGLTKGQYSPTCRLGTRSPSTPYGSVDAPGAAPAPSRSARAPASSPASIDTDQKHLPEVLKRAHAHKGAAFVEIFQNCIVYNDERLRRLHRRSSVAEDEQLHVEHGKPLIFGKETDKGLRLKPGTFELEAVTIGENGVTEADLLVHDETNRTLATILANLPRPEFPVALGVLFAEDAPVYEDAVHAQIDEIAGEKYSTDIDGLLRAGRTWTVE